MDGSPCRADYRRAQPRQNHASNEAEAMTTVELHGRSYRPPARPTVVVCADGCDPAYIEAGLAAGVLPTIARWQKSGFYALAEAAMPTFTNPNNLSIVTGAPPSVHGISGNFALDRDSGAEIMMTDPEMVRGTRCWR